ncbi:ATP-binding protein [Leucothrix pacifica]|uniref:AAA-ATPase-like domain-containing protein n=1 Tax=Leucothrix pacifica TaxID=1247513 RepID=A0A317CPJ6_9GAMM|nr:ATP-binding protein [Leucothrix pacifica]PWR00606.1 hypothetical protein DKW60_00910 [Leucothrix pacifica]
MKQRKKLPIGIQTFRDIRENDYYYVDKTQMLIDLIEEGKHYFLSRPRRFGKSLFLDTLKELFEGNQPLFTGLAAHEQWDWTTKYPVLRLSFGGGQYTEPNELQKNITEQLDHLDKQFGHSTTHTTLSGRFRSLIRYAQEKSGQQVAILVDEYDKPVLDVLHKPELAKANRDLLLGFYGTVKDSDAHIKFSFFTGVSNFTKASIFSGLNNLTDISLDPNFSTVCGYTDHDIDTVFEPELDGLDRNEIRDWYNGYNWLGEGVYNPFDVLQLFRRRKYSDYWFETGTPTFLVNWLIENKVPTPSLEKMLSTSDMMNSFDIEKIGTEALLFQTGYLTIKKEENLGGNYFYTLGYPNREVEQSLNQHLLSSLVQNNSEQARNSTQLYQLLLANDFDGLSALFQRFYASIPHQWYSNNEIQNYEGYYASVFYSYFASLGLKVTVEDSTNLGRIDMTLTFNQSVYIFEFKVVELSPEGKALQQIKDKAYADKFVGNGQPVYLLGVEFSKDQRNIVGFDVERV